MARVCVGAEAASPALHRRSVRFDAHFEHTDEAIALATAWTAGHMHARANLALTESGATAMMMSRSEPRLPTSALTPHDSTRPRTPLCRGAYPIAFESNTEAPRRWAERRCREEWIGHE